jgi:hypothetical protein
MAATQHCRSPAEITGAGTLEITRAAKLETSGAGNVELIGAGNVEPGGVFIFWLILG